MCWIKGAFLSLLLLFGVSVRAEEVSGDCQSLLAPAQVISAARLFQYLFFQAPNRPSKIDPVTAHSIWQIHFESVVESVGIESTELMQIVRNQLRPESFVEQMESLLKDRVVLGYQRKTVDDHTANVCQRSKSIVTFLSRSFNKSCEQITKSDLATVTEIDELNLKFNESLSRDDFNGFVNLNSVSLIGNFSGPIPDDLLSDLPNLLSLKMYGFNFRFLPPGLLQSLTKLEELSLRGNQIESIPAAFFRDQKNLVELDLGLNRLTDLPEDFFPSLPALEFLVLTSNCFEDVPQALYTDRNTLTRVEIKDKLMNAFKFKLLKHKALLRLKGVQLVTL